MESGLLSPNKKIKKKERNVHLSDEFFFDLQKKEGFYKNISDLKKEFNLKIDNLLKFQRENEEKLENQITSILTKQNDLYEKYTNLKVKNDSINEMNVFKNKTEGDIFTHSVKIEQLSKDVMNMMYKYDKIYLDNFNFPGLIGNDGCRFQNFREYVKYQISKTDSFLKEKTNQDEVIQNLNLKNSQMIDNFAKQNEFLEKKIKQYTNIKFEEITKNMNSLPDVFINKCEGLKIENSKYAADLVIQAKRLAGSFDTIKKIEEELTIKIAQFEEKNKQLNIERNKEIDRILFESQEIKNDISYLTREIKTCTENESYYVDKINKIEKNHTNVTSKIDSLSVEVEKMNQAVNNCTKMINTNNNSTYSNSLFMSKLNSLSSSNNESTKSINSNSIINYNSSNNNNNNNSQQNKSEVERWNQIKKEIEKKIYFHDSKISDYNKANQKQIEQMKNEMDLKITELLDQIKQNDRKHDQLKSNIDEFSNQNQLFTESLHNIKKYSRDLNSRIKSLESKINQRDSTKRDLDTIKSQNESFNRHLYENNQNIQLLNSRVNELMDNIQKVAHSIKDNDSLNNSNSNHIRKMSKHQTNIKYTVPSQPSLNNSNSGVHYTNVYCNVPSVYPYTQRAKKTFFSSIELYNANLLLRKSESQKNVKVSVPDDIQLVNSPSSNLIKKKLSQKFNKTNAGSNSKDLSSGMDSYSKIRERKHSNYQGGTFNSEMRKQKIKSVKLLYKHLPSFVPDQEIEDVFKQ